MALHMIRVGRPEVRVILLKLAFEKQGMKISGLNCAQIRGVVMMVVNLRVT